MDQGVNDLFCTLAVKVTGFFGLRARADKVTTEIYKAFAEVKEADAKKSVVLEKISLDVTAIAKQQTLNQQIAARLDRG